MNYSGKSIGINLRGLLHKTLSVLLQNQFYSVFSDSHCPLKSMPEFNVPPITSTSAELHLTLDHIVKATPEIRLDSAPGPDGPKSLSLSLIHI